MFDAKKLTVKLFADGADLEQILKLAARPEVKGFTTNPSLMRKSGVTDYEAFARKLIAAVPDRPVSFEVFSDEPQDMLAQGRAIAQWGPNVNVKIPVINTKGRFMGEVISGLSNAGVVVNVTAIFTLAQVKQVADCLSPNTGAIVSVFAGRIADTGIDPVPLMAEAKRLLSSRPAAELLWASPREVLNVFQADQCGCDIITATPDILNKLSLYAKDLEGYSLETVKMFYEDAKAAGYSIRT